MGKMVCPPSNLRILCKNSKGERLQLFYELVGCEGIVQSHILDDISEVSVADVETTTLIGVR